MKQQARITLTSLLLIVKCESRRGRESCMVADKDVDLKQERRRRYMGSDRYLVAVS